MIHLPADWRYWWMLLPTDFLQQQVGWMVSYRLGTQMGTPGLLPFLHRGYQMFLRENLVKENHTVIIINITKSDNSMVLWDPWLIALNFNRHLPSLACCGLQQPPRQSVWAFQSLPFLALNSLWVWVWLLPVDKSHLVTMIVVTQTRSCRLLCHNDNFFLYSWKCGWLVIGSPW